MKLTETTACRICSGSSFETILDLGTQKIANYFHDGSEAIPEAPLVLRRCAGCSMVQLGHSVDTDVMYRRYWYRSGINQTMRSHLMGVASGIMGKVRLSDGDPIIDIGCNDGTLLSYFPEHVDKIGVDPSNITPHGCKHLQTYFTADAVAPALAGRKAKVVASIAMFYDLDSPKSFVRDVWSVLADDGMWVLELSYLPRMIENTAYDSVCHEHVAYYSLRTFMKAIMDTDLSITDIQFNDINGGSFRMFLSPGGKHAPIVDQVLAKERDAGYGTETPYVDFAMRVLKSREELVKFLETAREQGKKVYGYGASTKGQIILQFCGLNSSHMTAIAERNPDKYGLYTPGSNVRICPEAEMRADRPDYVLMFPWYFFDEFKSRESSLKDGGTRFLLPLPTFHEER